MASTDFRDNLDSKDLGTANQILDQFERDVVAGVPVLIEHVRDNVEAHLRRYVVKSCVSIEIEQANSVTDEKLSDYLRRFPEYKTELLDVFKTWQEKIIAGFGDTIPLPAPNVEPTPLNINQESAIADSPFPFLLNGENYNFIRRIGGGGFADVYIGHSIPLNQDVAIKVIKERVSKDEQSTAANSREIEILRRMNHPGVVRLFEVERTLKGQTALVLELISGRTLAEFWPEKRGRMPVQLALQVITDVARALVHVHEQGIIHLDLKPANILIEENADQIRVVIADFGLSVFRANRGASTGWTPKYAASEQFDMPRSHWTSKSSHIPGARSDLFSAGVVLYKLLTGTHPFDVENSIEENNWPKVLEALRCRPEPPRSFDSSIPARLSDICLRCIEFDPDDRFSSAADLLDALATLDTLPEIVHSDAELLRLRSLTSRDRVFYRTLLNAAPNSSLNTQIDPLLQLLLPQKQPNTAEIADVPPRILTISAPSGAGKSSWFCAGVLPTLKEHDQKDSTSVILLNAEETAAAGEAGEEHTAEKLRKQLIYRLSLPRVSTASLTEILTEFKESASCKPDSRNPPKKLLIVIDQFEQWLSVYGRRKDTQLQQALSLCDGNHLQAVLIFRDEFITAATTLLRSCHARLQDGYSWFPIHPLTADEAASVLEHLRPTAPTDGTGTQSPVTQDSIRKYASGLLQELDKREKGVCPAWVVLVARFLRKHAANPDQLLHQHSWADVAFSHIRELLEVSGKKHPSAATLFPDIIRCFVGAETDGDLRRHVSFAEFQNACLKDTAETAINDALQCLETGDLIMSMQVTMDNNEVRFWQLTHEVWTRPLRHWLEQLPQTKAESLLAGRTAAWIRSGEARHLLNTRELLQVTRHVPVKRRSLDQQRFLQRSKWKVVRNWVLTATIAMPVLVWPAFQATYWQWKSQNLGKDLLISEVTTCPWLWRPLVISTLSSELDDRQRAHSAAYAAEQQGEILPLRLALLLMIDETGDKFRQEVKSMINGLGAIPEKLRHEVMDLLQKRAQSIQPIATEYFEEEINRSDPSATAFLRADQATLMFLAGYHANCEAVLSAIDDDHSERTLFINRIAPWLQIRPAVELLLSCQPDSAPQTTAAVLTALDTVPNPLPPTIVKYLQSLANSKYASVASAALYLSQKLGQIIPQGTPQKSAGVDWVTLQPANLFLIRVEVPSTVEDKAPLRPLWVARTEFTAGQLRQIAPHLCRDDDGLGDLPLVNRSISEMLDIIHAINEHFGFPDTWERKSNGWFPVAGARGFRLLLLHEGLHIAAAGSPSNRPLGRYIPSELYFQELSLYAQGQSSSSTGRNERLTVGSKRPNSLGFVDALGNVCEVVVGPFPNTDLDPAFKFAGDLLVYSIGGDYCNPKQNMGLDRMALIPERHDDLSEQNTRGFRIVCDAPDSDVLKRARVP